MLIIPKFEPHSPHFSLGFRHTRLVITADRVQQRPHLFKLASSLALPFLESHVYTHHILPDLPPCFRNPFPFLLISEITSFRCSTVGVGHHCYFKLHQVFTSTESNEHGDQTKALVTLVTKFPTKFP